MFYRQGETLPMDTAQIMMLVSGHVQLKARATVMDTLSEGASMGLEPLRGEPYQHTAICISPNARVLCISVADFVMQFMGGRLSHKTAVTASPRRHGQDGQADHIRVKEVKEMSEALARPTRREADVRLLHEQEWRTLRSPRLSAARPPPREAPPVPASTPRRGRQTLASGSSTSSARLPLLPIASQPAFSSPRLPLPAEEGRVSSMQF